MFFAKHVRITEKRDAFPWASWVAIMRSMESLIGAVQVERSVRDSLSASMEQVQYSTVVAWGVCCAVFSGYRSLTRTREAYRYKVRRRHSVRARRGRRRGTRKSSSRRSARNSSRRKRAPERARGLVPTTVGVGLQAAAAVGPQEAEAGLALAVAAARAVRAGRACGWRPCVVGNVPAREDGSSAEVAW